MKCLYLIFNGHHPGSYDYTEEINFYNIIHILNFIGDTVYAADLKAKIAFTKIKGGSRTNRFQGNFEHYFRLLFHDIEMCIDATKENRPAYKYQDKKGNIVTQQINQLEKQIHYEFAFL